MTLPDLRTGRLQLRPVRPDDLAAIVRQIGDFDVAKMLTTVPHPYSTQDAMSWFVQTAAQMEDGERAFAIDRGEGLVGVVSTGRPGKEPEFGYWLGQDHWGKGIMTEAGHVVLAWQFDRFPNDTVLSGALDENRASLNVLSKLGFTRTGPYDLKIMSRSKVLPGTRMALCKEVFLRAERVSL